MTTETRPTGEQLRFVSSATGEHILDAYLEAAEKGGRQLPDMLADIFDATTGLFRDDIFEFRVTNDRKLQFRVGDYPDTTTGWRDVTSNPNLFLPRGTWTASTAYAATDVAVYNSAAYICSTNHTSTSTFDPTKWLVVGGSNVTNLDDLTDVTVSTPATGSILRYNGSQWVAYADSAYAAASHTHTIANITNLQSSLDAKAASSHTHAISDITNLQTSLNAKLDTSSIGSTVQAYDADLASIAALAGTSGFLKKTAANTWSLDTSTYLTSLGIGSQTQAWDADLDAIAAITGTSGLLRKTAANTWSLDTTSYANATHTHAIADVTNLQTTLNGKAATSHTHVIADVTNLQTTLDGKAAASHTHAISDVTNLQTSLDAKLGASAIGSTVQAYDATLQSLSALGTAADKLPYTTGADTWAETDISAVARTFLSATSVAAQLAALGLSSDSAKLVAITTNSSGFYTPSSGTKSILVILTGAGGAGGSAQLGSATTGFNAGQSGAGGSTIIFTMNATPANTFTITIGAQTGTTAVGTAQGASGGPSRFMTVTGIEIASAPGGTGGKSNIGYSDGAINNGDAVLGTPISAPNASYVTGYVGTTGGGGEGPTFTLIGAVTTTNGTHPSTCWMRQGAGGGTFWGPGGTPQSAHNFAANTLPASQNTRRNGTSAPSWGGGGTGGLILKRSTNTTVANATGGPGQAGICIILEFKK